VCVTFFEEGCETNACPDHKESGLHASSQGAIQPQPHSADQVTDATELPWKAVEHASDHLEMFSEENGYPLDVIEAKQQLQGRPQIFARLMDWTTASESQTLWLCGPIFNEGLSEINGAFLVPPPRESRERQSGVERRGHRYFGRVQTTASIAYRDPKCSGVEVSGSAVSVPRVEFPTKGQRIAAPISAARTAKLLSGGT